MKITSRSVLILGLSLLMFAAPACERSRPKAGAKPASSPLPPAVTIGRKTAAAIPLQTFATDEEIPEIAFPFDEAPGNLRVTLEVSAGATTGDPAINDVLFQPKGRGRLVVSFRKPWEGHPGGQVSVRCESGGVDSRADFEPELWSGDPGGRVAIESPIGEASGQVDWEKEVLLVRYKATGGRRPVELAVKGIFSKEPIPPRVKAGMKPAG